jgi:TonB family protein
MTDAMHAFVEGGIFMYVLAAHLFLWLLLSSVLLVLAVVRAVRIRSRASRLEAACAGRDAAAALRAAEAAPEDPIARVVGATARAVLAGRDASRAAEAAVLGELPGLHPLWAVACCLALVCGVSVTLLLGSTGEIFGLIQMFKALAYSAPEERAGLASMGLGIARYPATFSILVAAVVGIPAAISGILLATAASGRAERKAAVSLAGKLTGTALTPADGSGGAVMAGILFFLVLLAAGIGWMLPLDAKEKISMITVVAVPEPPSQGSGLGDLMPDQVQAPGDKTRVEEDDEALVGSLSKDEIRTVMKGNVNQVRYCYEKGLSANPSLEGKVVVSFVIDPKGKVGTCRIAESTLGNDEVESCIREAVAGWTFPEPKGGGIVKVSYPYVLTPSP